MATFKLNAPHYIDGVLYQKGDVVELENKPSKHCEEVGGKAAPAAKTAAKPAQNSKEP